MVMELEGKITRLSLIHNDRTDYTRHDDVGQYKATAYTTFRTPPQKHSR